MAGRILFTASNTNIDTNETRTLEIVATPLPNSPFNVVVTSKKSNVVTELSFILDFMEAAELRKVLDMDNRPYWH